jgi:hypothetical protein
MPSERIPAAKALASLHGGGGAPPGARRSSVAFMHVPKCAGSSVTHSFEFAFAPEPRAPQRFDPSTFCDLDDFDALHPQVRALIAVDETELLSLGSYKLICGHFSLPALLRLAQAESIATVIREPRARLQSLYAYWPIEQFTYLAPYDAWQHAERSLGEFLAQPAVAAAVDNQLCRLVLAGDPRIPERGLIPPAPSRRWRPIRSCVWSRSASWAFKSCPERCGAALAPLRGYAGPVARQPHRWRRRSATLSSLRALLPRCDAHPAPSSDGDRPARLPALFAEESARGGRARPLRGRRVRAPVDHAWRAPLAALSDTAAKPRSGCRATVPRSRRDSVILYPSCSAASPQ